MWLSCDDLELYAQVYKQTRSDYTSDKYWQRVIPQWNNMLHTALWCMQDILIHMSVYAFRLNSQWCMQDITSVYYRSMNKDWKYLVRVPSTR